jgi:hypothetical protein
MIRLVLDTKVVLETLHFRDPRFSYGRRRAIS